jgi:hypothetical protein
MKGNTIVDQIIGVADYHELLTTNSSVKHNAQNLQVLRLPRHSIV